MEKNVRLDWKRKLRADVVRLWLGKGLTNQNHFVINQAGLVMGRRATRLEVQRPLSKLRTMLWSTI